MNRLLDRLYGLNNHKYFKQFGLIMHYAVENWYTFHGRTGFLLAVLSSHPTCAKSQKHGMLRTDIESILENFSHCCEEIFIQLCKALAF